MRKGFTFSQLAIIILAMIILIGLVLIVITQKDQLANAITDIFGAGANATSRLEEQVGGLL